MASTGTFVIPDKLLTVLNYIPGSFLADLLLHPFDMATILVQLQYFPAVDAAENVTFSQMFLQLAVYSLYLPYILSSGQSIHILGIPAPSIFLYIAHIYKREGIKGCYRGLVPKISERIVAVQTFERVKQLLKNGYRPVAGTTSAETDDDKFTKQLVNNLCCQFFAVLLSHPFHVIMVHSVFEFTTGENNGTVGVTKKIHQIYGYSGFFVGLGSRLIGELLSLAFSLTYTNIINKQLLEVAEQSNGETGMERDEDRVAAINNYMAASNYKANNMAANITQDGVTLTTNLSVMPVFSVLNIILTSGVINGSLETIFNFFPQLKSRIFYSILLRDIIAKKISYPFLLVSHSSIVYRTGWEELPLTQYFYKLIPTTEE